MEWDDARYVLAVARAGSLSGAARSLGVSHPTVFRRLGRIEAGLGTRLFERLREGYRPTPAAEEVIGVARRIEESMAGLERRLAGRDLRPSGLVRATTTDSLLIGFLTPLFADFRAAHPAIELEVAVSNEMFSLARRDADVAIRPTRAPPEPLIGRKVAAIAMAVYVHEGHPAAEAGDLDSLAEFDWIGPDESLSHLPLAGWLAGRGLAERTVYRSSSLLGQFDAARSGLGLAVLPCFMADAEPSLTRIGGPIDKLEGELWLLTHRDLRRVARIRSFLDFMAGRLGARRTLLSGGSRAAPSGARRPPHGAPAGSGPSRG